MLLFLNKFSDQKRVDNIKKILRVVDAATAAEAAFYLDLAEGDCPLAITLLRAPPHPDAPPRTPSSRRRPPSLPQTDESTIPRPEKCPPRFKLARVLFKEVGA